MDEIKAALPRHSTEVDTTSAWDNGVHERRVTSPSTRDYFRRIYAFLNPDGDPTRKSSYSFIHHMVAADGTPGEANFRALATGIATLNGGRAGTVLRGSDREGVYNHLAAHYRDADREAPALMNEREMRCVIEYTEKKEFNSLTEGAQISWIDDDGEFFGTVVEVMEGERKSYLIREWRFEDEAWNPTENLVSLDQDLVEAKSYLKSENMETKANHITEGNLVQWDTGDSGMFYGDVLTVIYDGTVKGQPQGMSLQASQDNPVHLIRVWMWHEEEWIETNNMIVLYSDNLEVIDSLPNPMAENEPEDEAEDEPMMMEEDGMKSLDVDTLAKAIVTALADAGVKIDPPAGFSNRSSAANESQEEAAPAEEAVTEEAPVAEEAAPAEVAVEAPAEEVAEEAAPAEEAPVAEEAPAAEEAAPAEEAEEKALSISYEDLREFNDLFKML